MALNPVNVYPGCTSPTHHIALSDGIQKWGLRLQDGPRGIQEIPQVPSTLFTNTAQGKYGDFEPSISHIEQRTWHGGRAQEDFVNDDTRFFDSMNCWTMTPDRAFPAPQWRFANYVTAFRDKDMNLPGNVAWRVLTGDQRYIASSFAASATYNADKANLWIRRIGSPGTLTMALYSDTAGSPNASIVSQTVTTATVTDVVSRWHTFDWTSTTSLTSGTTYWVVIFGASTDNAASHWEVGVDTAVSSAKISTAGSTWSAASYELYYRVTDADTNRKWHFFELQGGFYAVSENANTASSLLFINGDRGTATAGTSTTLTDSNKSWGTTRFVNAWVKVIAGTGIGMAPRQIASHTATALTVSPAFEITPDSTSQYVIYGTDYWTNLASTGLGKVVAKPAVGSNVAYFPQGTTTIRRMRVNTASASDVHAFAADATDDADFLYTFYDAASGATQIWRARNGTVMEIARAAAQAWGTNLTFGTAISVGSIAYNITGLVDYIDQLWVAKEDSLWTVKNDRAARLNLGLQAHPSTNTGRAMAAHNLYLYVPWSHSLERLYQGTLDDMGPWRGAGLPATRTGPVSSLAPYIGWLFAGIDAGDSGYSSVLCWDGQGWHEIFRAPEAGQRIKSIAIQNNESTRDKLWISYGGDIVVLDLPMNTLNPLRDATFTYQHEAVLETSTIDMGATSLPKFFKEAQLISQNLQPGIEVRLEYQTDEDIGGSTWHQAETFHRSPEDTRLIGAGRTRQIRLRLRLLTATATTPPIVRAVITKGYARTPVKMQYNLRVKVGDKQRDLAGGEDADPDALVNWLRGAAVSAARIRMTSIWEQLNDKFVIVEPPTVLRGFTNTILNWWGGFITLTIREA